MALIYYFFILKKPTIYKIFTAFVLLTAASLFRLAILLNNESNQLINGGIASGIMIVLSWILIVQYSYIFGAKKGVSDANQLLKMAIKAEKYGDDDMALSLYKKIKEEYSWTPASELATSKINTLE